LDEVDQLGKVFHELANITGGNVIDELWNEGDEGVDVVEALSNVVGLLWEGGNWVSCDG